ncbi:MAG: ABC transporter substrate-binding protein [Campylobacteraceae bacterium]|jgi:NitT/TauT family transport system substrate-binding protein|nr:ABC transporter substrate-binding protein [Campylobacteraceae bacterium]
MKKAFLSFALFASFFTVEVFAQTDTLRISKQYGLGYLPLIVLEEHKLIEKNAKKAGLGDIKVEWITFGGGATANDGLLSGSVDLISNGVAPFVRLWDKTKGEVKAITSLDKSHIVLNSSNPKIKSLKDFTDKDKIALPSVKVSLSALILQIAVAKEFGIKNYDKLDHITVSLKHPDALIALTSGKSEITAHLTTEPFITVEQQSKNVHQVLSSNDLVDGGFSLNLISATTKFHKDNKKLISVFLSSLNEADKWINANKKAAAELYLKVAKSNESVELITQIINNPNVNYEVKPTNVTLFSDFLYDIGVIKTKPHLEELFFDEIFEDEYKNQ